MRRKKKQVKKTRKKEGYRDTEIRRECQTKQRHQGREKLDRQREIETAKGRWKKIAIAR